MQNSTPILAKLLANENITVIQGNFRTAYFDLNSRTLGLPVYKQYTQDVTNLMIGHEVGHALYTPFDGWHNSDTDFEFPRSFVNVIEDIRIERMIQSKYPGLVSVFKRGYKALIDENFFGTKDRDLDSYSLIDRINIKAKLSDLVDITFSDEELPLVQQAFAVKTFEDVLAACQAIYDFVKSAEETETDSASYSVPDDNDHDEDDEDQESNSTADSTSGQDKESSQRENSTPTDEESEKDSNDSVSKNDANSTSDNQDLESETDQYFRSNEGNLVDDSVDTVLYVDKISKTQVDSMVYPYEVVKDSRKDALSKFAERNPNSYLLVEIENEYKIFLDESKKIASVLAKEFEMRKAAYRSIRARTSRSGVLNTAKLHNYKFSDDIFKSLTVMADDKSHGMIMMIDYSGSMCNVLNSVVKQTLNLAIFCKKVNIPFKVYGFTNSGDVSADIIENRMSATIHMGKAALFELLNSSMNTAEFENACQGIYRSSCAFSLGSKYEYLGSTPLNECLLAMEHIIDDFRKKNNIQKMNFILLTDGEGQRLSIVAQEGQEENLILTRKYREVVIKTKDGTNVKTGYWDTWKSTNQILNVFRKNGINTIGFYLAENSYNFRGAVYSTSESFITEKHLNELRKKYNADKFVSFDNTIGYDKYFVLKGDSKSLNTDVDELDIDPDASQAQINKSFKKFASSKKANRVLATQFAQAIA